MRAEVLVVVAATLACVAGRPQMIYAGFDHILAFDSANVSVSAFDYRRHLPFYSTCDSFITPPLLKNVKMHDWLSTGARSSGSQSALEFTHMGYEVFLVEDKETGSYVTRRCRDFRPQLTALPCEPLGTGQSDMLKAPYKTIFIGNNRAMILNTQTSAYSIHPFDVDVHTGGDPFRFSSGPLLSGNFPFNEELDKCQFAYAQLKNHGGDLLLVKKPEGVVQGWRFHGVAKDHGEWSLTFSFLNRAPQDYYMSTLGENQVLFYKRDFAFTLWDISQDSTGEIVVEKDISSGNVFKGVDCTIDNATLCVSTDGCAWCPSSYTCREYDRLGGHFCDQNACNAPPLVDKIAAGQKVIVPDCITETDPNNFDIAHDDNRLPGNVRLSTEYRNDIGDHANAEAAPIHPAIDTELGEDPSLPAGTPVEDDIIHEDNSVGKGEVYVPPTDSDLRPCMNGNYDSSKGIEVSAPSNANWKMNLEPSDDVAPTFTLSPAGDAPTASEETHCDRKNGTKAEKEPKFIPRGAPEPAKVDQFAPAQTPTRHEEDLMNADKTAFSNIMGHMGVDEMRDVLDEARAPNRVGEPEGFKPKEYLKPHHAKAFAPSLQPSLRVVTKSQPDMMNDGLDTDGLANPDCTESGGNDGYATPVFNSAMMNSVKSNMPETLESQLNLFKDEEKHVEDNMPAPLKDGQLAQHLPEADKQYATKDVDFNTAINGVSADDEGERIDRIAHHASH
jgi:hypothetical protein